MPGYLGGPEFGQARLRLLCDGLEYPLALTKKNEQRADPAAGAAVDEDRIVDALAVVGGTR